MTDLFALLQPLYGVYTQNIVEELSAYITQQTVNISSKEKNAPLHHSYIMYTAYPNAVIYDSSHSALKNLTTHLDHIKQLGCNALHILPFLSSPMRDQGFDVSNFTEVNSMFGTSEELQLLINTANQHHITLFMDLIFNHVSDQHKWFKKAEAGEVDYQNYFFIAPLKPTFLRKYHEDSAVWAEFLVEDQVFKTSVAFPELIDEMPLWRKGKDGNWYYYTYYPFQIDLNWLNYRVFIEMAKILIYWACAGFSFRLDALPFLGKPPYKLCDIRHEPSHIIIQALRHLAKKINPHCILLAETYESMDTIKDYFGTDKEKQFDLSYNFHLCSHLWTSVVKHDHQSLWQVLQQMQPIPKHAAWLNFLRNHDELSLAHLNPEDVKQVQNELLSFGLSFREGYGISGRTFSLLNRHIERYQMIYFLLASLPYALMITYGDEIGKENIAFDSLNLVEKQDTRHINRGCISKNEISTASKNPLFLFLANLFHLRTLYADYFTQHPERLSSESQVFAAAYVHNSKQLRVYVNLSDTIKLIPIGDASLEVLVEVNEVQVQDNQLVLNSYSGVWLMSN